MAFRRQPPDPIDEAARDRLVDELQPLIQPYYSDPHHRPPFSAAELYTIAFVFLRKATMARAHCWIYAHFAFFNYDEDEEHRRECGCNLDTDEDECSLDYPNPDLQRIAQNSLVPIEFRLGPANSLDWQVTSINEARHFILKRLQSSLQEDGPFRFLDLPTDLRVRIYSMVLAYPDSGVQLSPLKSTGKRGPLCPRVISRNFEDEMFSERWQPALEMRCPPIAQHLALFKVSKQVYLEAMPEFYAGNYFRFTSVEDLDYFLRKTSPECQKFIRHIWLDYELLNIEDGYCVSMYLYKCALRAFHALGALTGLQRLDINTRKYNIWSDTRQRKNVKFVGLVALRAEEIPGLRILGNMTSISTVVVHGCCPLAGTYLKAKMESMGSKIEVLDPMSDDAAYVTNSKLEHDELEDPIWQGYVYELANLDRGMEPDDEDNDYQEDSDDLND